MYGSIHILKQETCGIQPYTCLIPQNCATTITLLAHDPDGDLVTCRYGYYSGECGLCNQYFSVDQRRCIISFPSGMRTGSYVMEMVLEDFPNKNIHLTYYDRTVVYKNSPYHRNTREAPNKSDKYWYWDYTSEETWTDSYEFTDFVTDYPETDLLTTFTEDTEKTTETYNTPEDTTETSIDTSTPFQLPETTEGTIAEITTEYFEGTTVDQETTHQISTEAVTIPYETTGWDFYTTEQQPVYTNPLSRIPLQFLVEATSPAPTCSFGEYRPRFLSPTPSHGTKLLVNSGKKFQLHLTAQAAYERISDFKVSGLPGMTKTFTSSSKSNTRRMVVEWTPKEDNVGEHVAVCFVAETSNGYQSELRCVVVVIGPSKLDTSLICHDNTMTLTIATSANDELNKIQLRLNDPKCLVSSNSTHLIASVGYNSCGTVTEETEENIVFKNTATNHDMSAVITRQNGISIPFNCSFPKKNRISASFRAHRSDFIFTEAGFGNFTYKIQFFTDSRFAEVNTQSPLEVILKELLYMEIQVSSSVPNINLFVESCKATPHDNPSDPIFYNIIENGCIKDNTVVVYPGSNKNYRFAMEAFAFIGDYPEVYINCIVILCKTGAPNTRCTQGCITKSMEASSKYRHRRSLISESQQHFISQGPVSMKRKTPTDKDEEKTFAVNGNTLVIALSVMATVGMISVTLNIYMKRARAVRYQRLHTQDF
ncbi:CUB and zona pellucida-like domain-containing protein 1 [Aquarana catesbeiana]|uniref:CUB and zona pellucida-like domain-containing protein 1 n=1 Tax=Aquarana catesbeiana TaxID=8400 RepID=UPI003CCA58BE